MKNKKINYSEIPQLKAQDFKHGRRLTSQESATFRKAYRNTFHEEPPHFGRPFKYMDSKLVPVSIRLHPIILTWAREQAHKKHIGYQSFLNRLLLRLAA
ncbi:MAG: AT hook motif protein [Elusimicrobia bacterium]|nr:AT hook motif protein [Elusimicrobiota bacterium]